MSFGIFIVIVGVVVLLGFVLDRLVGKSYNARKVELPQTTLIYQDQVWFPKWTPDDLSNFIEYSKKDNPNGEVLYFQIKNEHPQINRIVLEPYGMGIKFLFGTTYLIVGMCSKEELAEATATTPQILICSPAWNRKLLIVGDFQIQHESALFFYAQIYPVAIFQQDGTGTDAFG
jgi:hypothetical protein